MNSMKSIKKLATTLNKIFQDKTFIEEMIKNCDNLENMQHIMGEILAYYISTRDTKTYSYKELLKLIKQEPKPKNMKRNEKVQDALVRNIIDEGVVTHSFNGFNLPMIKKNGLGSDKNYDRVIGTELEKLEKALGTSEFLKNQSRDSSEIYYTSPGSNSIYYAMQQSPERLFHEPLNQGENPLPVLVGEKKEDYYLRVAIDKINKNFRLEEQPAIIENARKVITKLCSKRPQIALIPINSKKYVLNASNAFAHRTAMPLRDYLELQAKGDMFIWAIGTFFAHSSGGKHPSNCSDLVSTKVNVPASELEFISIPDSFEMLQIMAKLKGLQPGEKFDLYSLEKVEEDLLEKQPLTQIPVGEKINESELTQISQTSVKKESSIMTTLQPKTTQPSFYSEDEEHIL